MYIPNLFLYHKSLVKIKTTASIFAVYELTDLEELEGPTLDSHLWNWKDFKI